jgi:hypothetical protein
VRASGSAKPAVSAPGPAEALTAMVVYLCRQVDQVVPAVARMRLKHWQSEDGGGRRRKPSACDYGRSDATHGLLGQNWQPTQAWVCVEDRAAHRQFLFCVG